MDRQQRPRPAMKRIEIHDARIRQLLSEKWSLTKIAMDLAVPQTTLREYCRHQNIEWPKRGWRIGSVLDVHDDRIRTWALTGETLQVIADELHVSPTTIHQ